MANLLNQKYEFISDEHEVDVIDGGTLATRLIPIITEYDRVIIIDCVDVDDAQIGDVYAFDFDKVPDYITWNGSAHEVEMLQTLMMIDMMGDLPPVKIVGVVPYVIGENSTFTMTDEVIKSSELIEKTVLKMVEDFEIMPKKVKELTITDVSSTTYLEGFQG